MDNTAIPPIRVFVSHRLHSGPGPFILAQKRAPAPDSNVPSSTSAANAQSGSDLLKKIHRALHGSLTSSESTSYIHSTLYANIAPPWQSELELSWNRSSVVLSIGDVVQRQWNFANEGRPVQWACIGHLARPPKRQRSKVNVNEDPLMATDPADEAAMSATFGPFHHHTSHQATSHDTAKKAGAEPKEDEIVPAVFIFLRDVGRIYALDGTDYNFPLPFLTRRAWPLHPHGVLIQRMPEPGEFDTFAAEADEDYLLPTIFTLTNPWAEPSAVAIALGLVGSPARLKDETQYSSRRIPNISPKEIVLWTAPRADNSGDDIALTYNEEEEKINIWRYAYIRQNDAPKPLKKRRANAARRRSSMNVFNNAAETEASSDQEFDNFPSLALGGPDGHDSDPDESLPLSALPNRQPSLKATTMQAIGKKMPEVIPATPSSITGRRGSPALSSHRRGGSTTRNELSMTMDRMALNGRADAEMIYSLEPGVMKPTFWFEKLDSLPFSDKSPGAWEHITADIFDKRFDGEHERFMLSIQLPTSRVHVYQLAINNDQSITSTHLQELPSLSSVALFSTRKSIRDLFIIQPDNTAVMLTHGIHPMSISLDAIDPAVRIIRPVKAVLVKDAVGSAATVVLADGLRFRVSFDLVPSGLTRRALDILSLWVPHDLFFPLHWLFLRIWTERGCVRIEDKQFRCLKRALCTYFNVGEVETAETPGNAFQEMLGMERYRGMKDDPAIFHLHVLLEPKPKPLNLDRKPHPGIALVLVAFNYLAEDLRTQTDSHDSLLLIVPLICRIAMHIRPEWADYWKRLVPSALANWPAPSSMVTPFLDDRVPIWPADSGGFFVVMLLGPIPPSFKNSMHWDHSRVNENFHVTPSFAFGRVEPLRALPTLSQIYQSFGEREHETAQQRSEAVIEKLMNLRVPSRFLKNLTLGLEAPLKEAARTCQLSPPGGWSTEAYRVIGRDDMAESTRSDPVALINDGYRSLKDFLKPDHPRKTSARLIADAKSDSSGHIGLVSGVEFETEEFIRVRFAHDRRLESVARMLCSAVVPSVKIPERPDLSEADQLKEQQGHTTRIAERTLALPYGRALFTYGCVPNVTRESYRIPKMEYAIRIQPLNQILVPESGKLPPECSSWGEFHNGVAAGLRISPTAMNVDNSWIAFNKPTELTPEHAGFLYALGLTGHLRNMLTWHTFSYLTPKHDLTSIAILLGLSAANVGTGDSHVTKLLSVHTPALLPTPDVDLNISLAIQSAGLAGLGLLYMGRKHRRMAEVCLSQLTRKDLVEPDISNQGREAYTYSAGLAFGMIMLGRGSSIPADMEFQAQLRSLIHGEILPSNNHMPNKPAFDVNLASPAASIALGLMYLRTGKRDVAAILSIPDTTMAIEHVKPFLLLVRALSKCLILWEEIKPTSTWVNSQLPPIIRAAVARKSSPQPPESLQLAYYNIVAGCCFAIGLKYAGTADRNAFDVICRYYDFFDKQAHNNTSGHEQKIKRFNIREGLNIVTIALCMIMAGTGEIKTLKSLRYAYGRNHFASRYGTHVATHQALGLLFLGGGRYTLGTSNAAIAALVGAFFPCSNAQSSDNATYLQALRHLWVLAVEPRCITITDVDTKEAVFLPVKITTQEDGKPTMLPPMLAPTLIPSLERLVSIRIDTPRYWPFYFDFQQFQSYKDNFLRSQNFFVKRRTSFLAYSEDMRGSRSLFVRSGASAGDYAILESPIVSDAMSTSKNDLMQFISSYSNDPLFLAFADHFCCDPGETEEEQKFAAYCNASLLDCLLHDKMLTIPSHLTLYHYRVMPTTSRFFNLRIKDLLFAEEFCANIFQNHFNGKREAGERLPLIRWTTIKSVLHELDQRLDELAKPAEFQTALAHYVTGKAIPVAASAAVSTLGLYLVRHSVPPSHVLMILHEFTTAAIKECLNAPPPGGTTDEIGLSRGLRQVIYATGKRVMLLYGSSWTVEACEMILRTWGML